MKYPLLFFLIALLCGLRAVTLNGPWLVLLWPACSFLIVGVAYLRLRPGVFGKRPDGRMALRSTVLLFPCLLLTWGAWRLLRVFTREDAFNDLALGIIIGRRLIPPECPSGADCVLDLTCEFPEPRSVREGRDYRCFPILDGSVPHADDLIQLIQSLKDYQGNLYIHCAEGHGRAALVSACLIIAKGVASDSAGAMEIIRAKRPKVRLASAQRRFVDLVAPTLIENG